MSSEGTSLADMKGKHAWISKDAKYRKELEAKGEPTYCYLGAQEAAGWANKPSDECKAVVFQVALK